MARRTELGVTMMVALATVDASTALVMIDVKPHNCTLGSGFVALSRTDEAVFRSE